MAGKQKLKDIQIEKLTYFAAVLAGKDYVPELSYYEVVVKKKVIKNIL